MIAGRLKEIVKFLSPTVIKDGYGSTEIGYELKFTTRADVKYDNGGRELVNNEILNSYGFTFVIRSYHEINEKMIIEWKNKKYRILSIDDTDVSKLTINTQLIND